MCYSDTYSLMHLVLVLLSTLCDTDDTAWCLIFAKLVTSTITICFFCTHWSDRQECGGYRSDIFWFHVSVNTLNDSEGVIDLEKRRFSPVVLWCLMHCLGGWWCRLLARICWHAPAYCQCSVLCSVCRHLSTSHWWLLVLTCCSTAPITENFVQNKSNVARIKRLWKRNYMNTATKR